MRGLMAGLGLAVAAAVWASPAPPLAPYDVSGVWADLDENRAHGRDERIGMQAFDESVEFTYRLLKSMSSAK